MGKPTGKISGESNIIHLTTEEKGNSLRIPSVAFSSAHNRLYIRHKVSNNVNYVYAPETSGELNRELTKFEWTNLKLAQTLQIDGSYKFQVWINNELTHFVVNEDPEEFE